MNETLDLAVNYLSKKHKIVRVSSTGDIICDHKYVYSPRRVRGDSIWLSSRRLKQLKRKNAIILAIDGNNVVEIPSANIDDGSVFNGIKVKVVESYVRIRIPRELKKRLDRISQDPAEAISVLLGSYEKVLATPPVGLTNEALAFRTCLVIAKYRLIDCINLMNKIAKSGEVKLSDLSKDEVEIARKLASSRVIHIDHRHDGDYAKLLCTFKLEEKPDKVIFTMIYFRDFCRLYCYRYDTCWVRKSDANAFGFSVEYSPKEFSEKSPEELMAKWIGENLSCVDSF